MDPATARTRQASLVAAHCDADHSLEFIPSVDARRFEDVTAWSTITEGEWECVSH